MRKFSDPYHTHLRIFPEFSKKEVKIYTLGECMQDCF